MRIIFVRHGQSNYNIKHICNSDPSKKVYLTELGKRQIEDVGEKLKKEKIEIIFVSELPRTKESADIINKNRNAPIKIDKRINDRKTGFEGKSYFDYIKFIEKDRFNIKHEGGESFQNEKKRVFSFLEDVVKTSYKTILVVSHEEIMKIVKGYFEKLSDEEMWDIKVPNGYLIVFDV